MTHIMLIRHGETEWNARGLYQGHLNSPLTQEGLQQAQALAQRLRGHRIDALYTSDLGSTQETAAPLAKVSGLEPRVDARLRERNYGIFQGIKKPLSPASILQNTKSPTARAHASSTSARSPAWRIWPLATTMSTSPSSPTAAPSA